MNAAQPIGHFSAVRTVTVDLPEGLRPVDLKVIVAFEKPKA